MSVYKDLYVTNSITIGVNPTKYTLPDKRGSDNQILQTDSSGSVSWETPNGSSKAIYTLTNEEIIADSTTWVSVAYTPWDNDAYASYVNGFVRFYAESSSSYKLDVRLYDMVNLVELGRLSTPIDTSSIGVIPITNPGSDTSIELQVRNHSDTIVGVGTDFTSDLADEDTIMISDNTTSNFGIVSFISSTTSLFWGTVGTPVSITSATIYKATIIATQTALSSSSNATTVTGVGTNFNPDVSITDILMLVDLGGNISFGTVGTITNDTDILWTRTSGSDSTNSTIYKLVAITQSVTSSSAVLGTGGVIPTIKGSVLEFDTTAVLGSTVTYGRATTSNTTYNATASDEIIGVDVSSNTVTVILPQISTLSGIGHKKYFIIDELGNASTNNITIQGTGGDTINLAVDTNITTNFGSISLYSNGDTNWIIF